MLLFVALLLQANPLEQAAKLEISAAKTVFFLGETIPFRFSLTSTQPNTFAASAGARDSVSRISLIDFIVDPVADTEDPMQGLPGQSGGIGAISAEPVVLSQTPFVYEKILNEWVRFRKPGSFRVQVSRWVGRVDGKGPSLKLVSNVLTLEIRPAPAAWVKDQIDAAVKVLDGPLTSGDDAAPERFRAGRTLRFLDTPEAAVELVKHLNSVRYLRGGQDIDSYSLHLGVLGSPYRSQLLPLMEQCLIAPGQPVGEKYLDTLIRLAQLVTGEQRRDEYIARLGESMLSKQPQARVVSLSTLLSFAPGSGTQQYMRPSVVNALVTDFPGLPPHLQREFLYDWRRWSVVNGPAMIPILRQIYDTAPTPALADIALTRLFYLSPVEGRELILAQIRNPTKSLSNSALALLADPNLPELNDTLAMGLEGPHPNEWLILRYATGDIVKRVERYYLRQDHNCSSPLVFYFLKYDPELGEREFRRNLSTANGPRACYNLLAQFSDLGGYAMSDALQRLLIEYLSSPITLVQVGAAHVLGKYGSAAAKKPLWDALADYHSRWKDREEQLKQSANWEAGLLERTLELALLESPAWAVQEQDLQNLQALCSSKVCKDEILRWRGRALGR